MRSFPMDRNIRDNLRMELKVEKECLNGSMEKSMKGNGSMAKSMEAEYGKAPKDKATLANGIMVRSKASVSTSPNLETDTKESSKIPKSKVSERRDTIMEKHTLENTEKTDRMGKDNISGQMETITKVISLTILDMDQVTSKMQKLVNNTKGNTEMTKSVDMVNLRLGK